MPKGYVIIVRDYVAEICEFTTLQIINMPDGERVFFIETKYGQDYYKESDLSPIRKTLIEECDALNKELGKSRGEKIAERSNKKYRR